MITFIQNHKILWAFGLCLIVILSSFSGYAKEQTRPLYSPSLLGALGLNVVPSARHYEGGTITAGVSTLDPYFHGYLGFQFNDYVYAQIRQSAEVSNLDGDADRLFPGLDFKFKLLSEGDYVPEISVGLQSAFGHKRQAGEYLAFSKRYHDFDFTAGIGWGRFGSAGHFDNPFNVISDHFNQERPLDGEDPNKMNDWFTGEEAGFFAGLEYFTPIDGLSVKADYGADRFAAESEAFGFDAPAPWSLGLSYSPVSFVNAGLAVQGADKIMGRLTFTTNPDDWPFRQNKAPEPRPLGQFRPQSTNEAAIKTDAQGDDILLGQVESTKHAVEAHLSIDDQTLSAPHQIGRAVRHIAANSGENIEEITLHLQKMNLKGPSVKLIRKDFERALVNNQGSPQEIWQNAEIETDKARPSYRRVERFYSDGYHGHNFNFILENRFSLSEEDSGFLHRSSLIANYQKPEFLGFLTSGVSLRFNLSDDLDKLDDLRMPILFPVRSNIDEFAEDFVSIERLYSNFTYSYSPSIHASVTGGYLEEMYGGIGGEVLYRPFNSRFAVGGEAWLALARDPEMILHTGFSGNRVLSGHLNAWYEFPEDDLVLSAKLGRYLATDRGGTLGLQKHFENGALLEGYITFSEERDTDILGGTTNADHGIRLSLPLGSVPYIPKGSRAEFASRPFGRDIGQFIDNPVPLYEQTNGLSQTHFARHWGEVLE